MADIWYDIKFFKFSQSLSCKESWCFVELCTLAKQIWKSYLSLIIKVKVQNTLVRSLNNIVVGVEIMQKEM